MRLRKILKAFWPVNWYLLGLTVIVFFTLVKLGLWQLERAEEKETRLEKIAEFTSVKPKFLDILLDTLETPIESNKELLNDVPVKLSATFNDDIIFLLDNQPNKGQQGYRVFQLARHKDLTLLINLGWIQGSINRAQLPSFEPVKGSHKIHGNIRFIEQGIVLQEQVFKEENWPMRVQEIDVTKISRLIDKQLLPFVVFLDKKESLGYEKNWQPIVMPPEKHLGYAFQWFSLAIAWIMLMLWAAYKNNNK